MRLNWVFFSTSLGLPYVSSEDHVNGPTGQTTQHESTGSNAAGSGATADDNTGSINSSITATIGTETIGTAGVSEADTGINQPVTAMTQHERDDLLRGLGSQFDSVSGHVSNGARSTAGRENH